MQKTGYKTTMDTTVNKIGFIVIILQLKYVKRFALRVWKTRWKMCKTLFLTLFFGKFR